MFLRIIASQARYKWPVTALLWAAMTALVSLYVYLGNSVRFSNRSMQLIMKRMGHNLLILPRRADPLASHLCTPDQVLFADDVTRRMAARTHLASRYYASVLQQLVPAGGGSVILTGIEPVHRADETPEKAHLLQAIPPGRAVLGAEAARRLDAAPGDRIDVLARAFEVASVAEEVGSVDDCRVYVSLKAGQELLGRAGQINAIWAFLCQHGTSLRGVSRRQQEEFARLFPDYRVITKTPIARGRYLARMTTQRYLSYLLAIVLCITMVIIAVTGLQEVSERRQEVGILLAMGANYAYVVGLYLVKLLAIALAAAAAGFLIGSYLSGWLLSPVLVAETRPVAVVWGQLPQVAALTCLVALLAEAMPMIQLVRMDPNAILVQE